MYMLRGNSRMEDAIRWPLVPIAESMEWGEGVLGRVFMPI